MMLSARRSCTSNANTRAVVQWGPQNQMLASSEAGVQHMRAAIAVSLGDGAAALREARGCCAAAEHQALARDGHCDIYGTEIL
jgi:hypothetical protein